MARGGCNLVPADRNADVWPEIRKRKTRLPRYLRGSLVEAAAEIYSHPFEKLTRKLKSCRAEKIWYAAWPAGRPAFPDLLVGELSPFLGLLEIDFFHKRPCLL